MVGVEGACDAARVRGLGERRVVETDREGLEAPAEMPRGERGDRARVDPPREEDPERDVAHEVLPHREIEHGAERLHGLDLTDRLRPAEVDVPVRLDLDPALGIREPVAGRELLDRSEDRMRRRDVLVGEIAGQRGEVERPVDRRVPEERPDRKSTRLNSSHGYISYAV